MSLKSLQDDLGRLFDADEPTTVATSLFISELCSQLMNNGLGESLLGIIVHQSPSALQGYELRAHCLKSLHSALRSISRVVHLLQESDGSLAKTKILATLPAEKHGECQAKNQVAADLQEADIRRVTQKQFAPAVHQVLQGDTHAPENCNPEKT